MDHDKIIVMKAGSVVEFGTPLELLQRRGGMLRSLGKSGRNLRQLVRRASTILEDKSRLPKRFLEVKFKV